MRHRSRTLLTVQTVRTAITSITIAYLDRFEAKMAELSQMLASVEAVLSRGTFAAPKKAEAVPQCALWFHEMARSAGTRMTPKCRVPARWSAPIGLLLPSQQCGPGQHEPRSLRARCNPVRVRSNNEFSLKLGHCGEDVHQPDATKCGIERPHRSIFHTAMASPCAVSPRPSAEQESGGCRAAVSCHPRRGEKIGSRSQKTMDQTKQAATPDCHNITL